MDGDVPPRRTKSILALVFAADLAIALIVAAFLEPSVGRLVSVVGHGLSLERVLLVAGPEARPVRYIVLVGTVFLACFLGQFEYTRRSLLAAVDGQEADPESDSDLLASVEDLADRGGVRTPTVVVAETTVPNSFSLSGYRSGTVVVSHGLLAILPPEELEAVLAHELAHLRGWDAFTMTISSFLPVALSREYSLSGKVRTRRDVLLAATCALLVWYPLSAPFFEASLLSIQAPVTFASAVAVTVLLGTIALGFLATPIGLFRQVFSRRREFIADAHAAALTSPDALAGALGKLEDATEAMAPQHDDLEALFFLPHGFTGPRNAADGVTEAYTHPAIEDRIDRLEDLEVGE